MGTRLQQAYTTGGITHEMPVLQSCFAFELESLLQVGPGSAFVSFLLQVFPSPSRSGPGSIDDGCGMGDWHPWHDFMSPVARRLLGLAGYPPSRVDWRSAGQDVGQPIPQNKASRTGLPPYVNHRWHQLQNLPRSNHSPGPRRFDTKADNSELRSSRASLRQAAWDRKYH